MNLNQLYYFKTLAELEHYTKAAEKLNISQPTLSHSISAMEKELVAALKAMLGIYAKVRLVDPKSIARSEGKAVRIIDKRKI